MRRSVSVVTGPTSGIGRALTNALAARGDHVILVGRDATRLSGVVDELTADGGSAEAYVADLSDLGAVQAAGAALAEDHPRIDLLVNNAAVMGIPLSRTTEGFEGHFATNYLSHFALTGALIDALPAGPAARVINIASSHQGLTGICWDDPNYLDRPYDKFEAYAQSKAATVLHALALDRRLRDRAVRAVALAPGAAQTRLFRNLDRADLRAMLRSLPAEARRTGVPIHSAEHCAESVMAASQAPLDDLTTSGYLIDRESAAIPVEVGGDEEADRLWTASEMMLGRRSGTPRPGVPDRTGGSERGQLGP